MLAGGPPEGEDSIAPFVKSDAIRALEASRPVEELARTFAEGRITMVTDHGEVTGLLTPIDLLDFVSREDRPGH